MDVEPEEAAPESGVAASVNPPSMSAGISELEVGISTGEDEGGLRDELGSQGAEINMEAEEEVQFQCQEGLTTPTETGKCMEELRHCDKASKIGLSGELSSHKCLEDGPEVYASNIVGEPHSTSLEAFTRCEIDDHVDGVVNESEHQPTPSAIEFECSSLPCSMPLAEAVEANLQPACMDDTEQNATLNTESIKLADGVLEDPASDGRIAAEESESKGDDFKDKDAEETKGEQVCNVILEHSGACSRTKNHDAIMDTAADVLVTDTPADAFIVEVAKTLPESPSELLQNDNEEKDTKTETQLRAKEDSEFLLAEKFTHKQSEPYITSDTNMLKVNMEEVSKVHDSTNSDMEDIDMFNVAKQAEEKTELEREMELYEAAEEEEQNKLLTSIRPDQQRELLLVKNEDGYGQQNDRKRALDQPSQEGRKKRGRKAQKPIVQKEEDDVCFVCFDGGKLVLCDRRSCPKAYHLNCIGRDDAFFRKKGAWICGWHFCCGCSRSASIQCYTCPKAYCAACSKESGFLSIRKRKGLCEDCLPIVKMIERNESVNADGVQVDFNDQETYECLFKEYWENLRSKLGLKMPKLDEEGKVIEGTWETDMGTDTDDQSDNEESGSESEDHDNEDGDTSGERKHKDKKSKLLAVASSEEDSLATPENVEEDKDYKEKEQVFRPSAFEGWASKEILEFLKYMNEDPKKPLSRFSVNKLLWAYIKDNKLQNPQKRTIINCDEMLHSLFGKKSVQQFEMTKLLQLHFPPKGSISTKRTKQTSSHTSTAEDNAVDLDNHDDKLEKPNLKEKRRLRRKSDSNELARPDSSEYAAVNQININLIYLRRALVEDLIGDTEFENKVVGTFVRIRVPGSGSKNEMCYRLVQVVGVKKQLEEYKTGRKTTNVILEIMNLHKRETLTIDLVSNQDFTEEECKRLRQSIRCGFIRALKVGEVEQKALAIREAKLNDWFEMEHLRVSALRDRANEKGRKKELRECVEKLQRLSNPDFRAKELSKAIVVLADATMDPDYESSEETNTTPSVKAEVPIPADKGSTKYTRDISSKLMTRDKSSGGANNWDATMDDTRFGRRDRDSNRHRSCHSSKIWETAPPVTSSREHEKFENDFKTTGSESGRLRDFGNESFGKGQIHESERSFAHDSSSFEQGWDREFDWKATDGRPENESWIEKSNAASGESKYGNGRVNGDSESNISTWDVKSGYSAPSLFPSSGQQQLPLPQLAPPPPLPSSSAMLSTPTPATPHMHTVHPAANMEREKIWCYRDPTGTVQGPFSVEQLRKWNTTGLFPMDLRIWKASQSREESILLTDALAGNFGVDKPWRALEQEMKGLACPPPSAVSTDGWTGRMLGPEGDGGNQNEWNSRVLSAAGTWSGNAAYNGSNYNHEKASTIPALESRNFDQVTKPASDWSGWTPTPQAKSEGWGPTSTGGNNSWGNPRSDWNSQQKGTESGGWGLPRGNDGWTAPEAQASGWVAPNVGGWAPLRPDGGWAAPRRDIPWNQSSETFNKGASRGPSVRKSIPCRYFPRGFCKNGDACPYQH